jgi:glyoxylate reductase
VSRPKVFVTRTLPGDALTLLSAQAEVDVWQDEGPPPRAAMLERTKAADGLITLLTDKVDAELLAAAPRLRAVSNVAVGYDNIDIEACTQRRIPVGHTPGVLTETSAELTFSLMLAAARRVVESDAYVRAGQWRTWDPGLFLGRDLNGATLGIVGLGQIGAAVARMAQCFQMRVLYTSRTPKLELEASLGVQREPLQTLLAESDFISLHVPLSDETRRLIDRAAFARMKPTAILVNAARGPVVDTAALIDALTERRIAGAALDVTDPEPLPGDHPLLRCPNLTITPHIGSATIATRSRMAVRAVENLLAGLRGERPRHCVNARALGLS